MTVTIQLQATHVEHAGPLLETGVSLRLIPTSMYDVNLETQGRSRLIALCSLSDMKGAKLCWCKGMFYTWENIKSPALSLELHEMHFKTMNLKLWGSFDVTRSWKVLRFHHWEFTQRIVTHNLVRCKSWVLTRQIATEYKKFFCIYKKTPSLPGH